MHALYLLCIIILFQYFAAPDLNNLESLERPILTERIRLRIVDWFASRTSSVEYICLGIGLYGCLATEGENDDICTLLQSAATLLLLFKI